MTNPFEDSYKNTHEYKTPFDDDRRQADHAYQPKPSETERRAINNIAEYAKKTTADAKKKISTEAKKEIRKETRKIRKEGSKVERKAHYQVNGTGKRQGVRPGETGPNSVETVLTDWDQMLLAKYFPGEIDAPFVAGMNTLPVPTSTFHVSTEISIAPKADTSIDGNRFALGTQKFCVLAFCPSITSHLGTNGSMDGERLSGLQILQSDSAATKILFQDGFNRVSRTRLCAELYGSDFKGFAQSGMIWASSMQLSMLAPLANVVGAVYEGALTLSQLPEGGLSVGDMIRIAQKNHTGGTQFELRGAVVNHSMIFNHHDPAGTVESVYEDLALETVHYLVFQTPVISIVDSTNSTYSFLATIKGNYLFWPNATDPFANRLGAKKTQADQYLGRTISASGMQPSDRHWFDPLVDYGKEFYNQHKTEIGNVLSTGASLFMPAVGGLAAKGIRMVGDFLGHQTRSAKGGVGQTGSGSTNPFQNKRNKQLALTSDPSSDYLIKVLSDRTITRVLEEVRIKDFINQHRFWIEEVLEKFALLQTYYNKREDMFSPDLVDPDWPLVSTERELVHRLESRGNSLPHSKYHDDSFRK